RDFHVTGVQTCALPIYAFFARHARTLFVDEDFAPLYRQGGRPSVPPSLLAVAVLLQRIHNLSDQALIDATKFDLRFKVALGLARSEERRVGKEWTDQGR